MCVDVNLGILLHTLKVSRKASWLSVSCLMVKCLSEQTELNVSKNDLSEFYLSISIF